MIVANLQLVSPSLEPRTFVGLPSITIDDIDDDRGPQVFKSVNFFSLPPLVSRSSPHFSQLISQIGPNWPKSWWHEEHSEVHTYVRIDWAIPY